jgi:hypothetical protein
VNSFYNRRSGAIPHSRKFCWVRDDTAAANLLKNIRRAVRSGNCDRAKRIAESSTARAKLLCAKQDTLHRIERLVRNCRARKV